MTFDQTHIDRARAALLDEIPDAQITRAAIEAFHGMAEYRIALDWTDGHVAAGTLCVDPELLDRLGGDGELERVVRETAKAMAR